MNKKILSLIIPSYNMENFLNNCISSLVVSDELMDAQEIIIVNDGSKDNTLKIATDWANKFQNSIRIIDKKNGNYGSCINAALNIATGTFVKVLDADDSFDTNNYEDFLNLLIQSEEKNENVDVFFSDFIMVDNEGNEIKKIAYPFNNSDIFSYEEFPDNIVEIMCMHALTYRTKKILELNYKQSEGISYTDQEWIFTPMANMNSFRYFQKIIYKYLVGRDGQTISPESHAKNMWMELDCTKKMISDFVAINSIASAGSKNYLEKKIFDRCRLMYEYYILAFRNKMDLNQLLAFESYLKEKLPDVYEELIHIKYYGYSYIKNWRQYIVNRKSVPNNFYKKIGRKLLLVKIRKFLGLNNG